MKKLYHLLFSLIPLYSSYAFATGDESSPALSFSGNVSLASDYRWRGQTQTQNRSLAKVNLRASNSPFQQLNSFLDQIVSVCFYSVLLISENV